MTKMEQGAPPIEVGDCPSEDELAAMMEEGLTGERPDVEAHLARCSKCCGLVATVAAGWRGEGEAPSPEPRAPVPGERVGRYVVSELIGAGAMGTVYVAHDPELKRQVAVKLLRWETNDADEMQKRSLRLRREAQAMAQLSHPNVVTIHDVGEWDGQIFIAMALIDGGTLREWWNAAPRSWIEILDAFVLAGRGLAAAHASGLVHRDFKPDNVLVTRAGDVCVTDFGLARPTAESQLSTLDAPPSSRRVRDALLTRTGALVGTPAYMSPEQFDSAEVDARSDIFSFSVALWEALYGARPFRGATPSELRVALRSEPATPERSAVPRAVRDVVRGGLHEDPSARHATMATLLDALAAARDAEVRASEAPVAPGDEPRDEPSPESRRPPRRGRWAAIAVVAAGTAALVAIAIRFEARPLVNARVAPAVKAEATLVQLTTNSSEAPIGDVSISPDGAWIAYSEARGVFIEDLATRHARRVVTTPALRLSVECARWFADGRHLLVQGALAGGRGDLWSVDVASGAASPLGVDEDVPCGAPSPDGARIALATRDKLELLDVGRATRVTLYDEREVSPPVAWSPDGQRIAFAVYQWTRGEQSYAIEVVDADGRGHRTVVDDSRLVTESGTISCAWSANDAIVFGLSPSVDRRSSGIFSLNVPRAPTGDAGQAALVPRLAGPPAGAIAADARGTRMALLRNDSQADIFVGALANGARALSRVERVTPSERNERPSDWTSDSRALLMVSDVEGGHAAFRVPLDSRVPEPILPLDDATGSWTSWPVQAPNDAGVLVWRFLGRGAPANRGAIVLVPPRAPARDVYVPDRAIPTSYAGRPPPRLWTVRCARSADVCVLAHPSAEHENEMELERVALDGQGTTPLARIPGRWMYGFALSPDGARIAAVRSSDRHVMDVFDLTGRRLAALTAPPNRWQFAAFTADGAAVLATAWELEHAAIYRLGLDGRASQIWSTKGAWISNLAAAPDGSRLAFAVVPYGGNVWLYER